MHPIAQQPSVSEKLLLKMITSLQQTIRRLLSLINTLVPIARAQTARAMHESQRNARQQMASALRLSADASVWEEVRKECASMQEGVQEVNQMSAAFMGPDNEALQSINDQQMKLEEAAKALEMDPRWYWDVMSPVNVNPFDKNPDLFQRGELKSEERRMRFEGNEGHIQSGNENRHGTKPAEQE